MLPALIKRALIYLYAVWISLQVELHGQYSTVRLQELYQYTETQSLAHVLMVTLLTPVPCVTLVALIECIPLRPIQDGLPHSLNFWIRNVLTLFPATSCILEQVRFCIRHIPIRGKVVHGISLVGSTATVYAAYLAAGVIGYPLPFTIPLSMAPWLVLVGLPLWLSMRSVFQRHPGAAKTVFKYTFIIACQLSLIIVYSVYNAAFANLTSHWQFLFSLALPLIKLIEKNLFSRLLLAEAQDLKPEIVIFNVEVFNALFTAICMQQATSIATSFALIGVDFVHACLSHRDLEEKLRELRMITQRMEKGGEEHIQNVFSIIISDTEFTRVQSLRTKSWSTEVAGPSVGTTELRQAEQTSVHKAAKNQVAPTLSSAKPDPKMRSALSSAHLRTSMLAQTFTMQERHELGQKVLEILHLAEFLLLIEFVEVMIPLVYCLYMFALFHLPNREFYPNLKHMDQHELASTLRNVVVYGTLELLSFVTLCFVLKRKLHISPLHHLAFVLETQCPMVQSKLVLWVIYSLQTSIEHFGMDYTFQFLWMRKPAA